MYTAKGQPDRDALLRQHAPLVRRIAHHLIAKLPANVELDELIQVGMIGLHDALSRYQATQGVQLETFVSRRIRGAMLDELRDSDWLSRGTRKGQKDIEKAIHRLEQQLGRNPHESEIAAELGMSLAAYQSLLAKVRGTALVHLEDLHHSQEDGEGADPLERHVANEDADPMRLLRQQRLQAALVKAIESLPEREQYIMGMYYEHDMNLKEIAAVLGVTESRVCQLHSQAIGRLRVKMAAH